MTALEMGIIGLGRMGGGLALQAREKGIKVVGFTRGAFPDELVRQGIVEAASLEDLRTLRRPRAVFLYIPAGARVDDALEQLARVLDPQDIVIDGGNSYWGDSIRRAERLVESGLHFVDVGTSGGVTGARHGACFMAGGDEQAVAKIEPLLRALAVPGGFVHAGPSGAGHFTKLVHNGIEFGMLQAIGEGLALLESRRLPVADIFGCWRNGSVIRSWLIELMHEQYRSMGGLGDVPSHIEDTGEVNWLVSDAMEMEVPIPVIGQAVMQLLQSRDATFNASRAVALMRRGFGGHPLGHAPAVVEERRTGRVGDIVAADSGRRDP
jgi:6-phosphogluconate dehydrogenase